jgi:hypothetical protein
MADRYEQTRKRFEDRKARLLNTKQRAMGLDLDALDSKVAENRLIKQRDREDGLREVAQTRAITEVLNQQDADEAYDKSAQVDELKSDWYHQANQRFRREADLNPKLVKTTPINPANCGIAACQSFMGEDHDYQRRRKLQSTQFKQWCELKMVENKSIKEQEKDEDKQYCEYLKRIDEVRLEHDVEEGIVQSRKVIELRDDNKFLAKTKKVSDQRYKQENEQYNQWEVQNQLSNPVLAEDPNQAAAPGLGPTRVRRDHWKGMAQEEINEIYAFNALQMDEKAQKAAMERDEDKNWAAHNDTLKKWVDEQEYDSEVQKQDALYSLVEDRKIQAVETKVGRQFEKQQAVGAIDEKFFGSFGVSGR